MAGGVWGGVSDLVGAAGSIWTSSINKKMASEQYSHEQLMLNRQNSFEKTMYGLGQEQDEIDFQQNMKMLGMIIIPIVAVVIGYLVMRKAG